MLKKKVIQKICDETGWLPLFASHPVCVCQLHPGGRGKFSRPVFFLKVAPSPVIRITPVFVRCLT